MPRRQIAQILPVATAVSGECIELSLRVVLEDDFCDSACTQYIIYSPSNVATFNVGAHSIIMQQWLLGRIVEQHYNKGIELDKREVGELSSHVWTIEE